MQNLLVSNYEDGTKDDQLAFKLFFNAEALIYQNKTYEAISNLEKIISQHPDALITPLSTLRLAILLTELNEFDKAHKIALSIQNSDLKDQSLILAGEINEKFRGDNKNAIKSNVKIPITPLKCPIIVTDDYAQHEDLRF